MPERPALLLMKMLSPGAQVKIRTQGDVRGIVNFSHCICEENAVIGHYPCDLAEDFADKAVLL